MEVENERAQECRGNPRSAPEFATATVRTYYMQGLLVKNRIHEEVNT